jgi:hypothetical protein
MRETEKQFARADLTGTLKIAREITVDSFAKAEIPGITSSNIAEVQAELLSLPEEARTDINQVLKIAYKYEVVDRISGDNINSVSPNTYIEIGLIPATSKYKVALVSAIKKLPPADRDSFMEIKAAIEVETKKIEVRKDRLASLKARTASRSIK